MITYSKLWMQPLEGRRHVSVKLLFITMLCDNKDYMSIMIATISVGECLRYIVYVGWAFYFGRTFLPMCYRLLRLFIISIFERWIAGRKQISEAAESELPRVVHRVALSVGNGGRWNFGYSLQSRNSARTTTVSAWKHYLRLGNKIVCV